MTMTRPTSHRRVYKTIGSQDIDVDVYLPENAKKCPLRKLTSAHANHR